MLLSPASYSPLKPEEMTQWHIYDVDEKSGQLEWFGLDDIASGILEKYDRAIQNGDQSKTKVYISGGYLIDLPTRTVRKVDSDEQVAQIRRGPGSPTQKQRVRPSNNSKWNEDCLPAPPTSKKFKEWC